MKTTHKVLFKSSISMDEIESGSINLVVTSPPYPMIKMWDKMFCKQNTKIDKALQEKNGAAAFELMHRELDKVWKECYRVFKPGGILCINVGDATRKIANNFQLYSSHSRILNYCRSINFHNLPNIIWRKTTNAPNKFMGSGMYPPGAYVTLEHEHILIFRKGEIRKFNPKEEKQKREQSAFFWEERNRWFSDVWTDITGIAQNINDKDLRKRSAAFPFELVYRLINMFSVIDDVVLDPFMGTGTTMAAAAVCQRNSIGYEIEKSLQKTISKWINNIKHLNEERLKERIVTHRYFIKQRRKGNKETKYRNENYNFPCISKQETKMKFSRIVSVNKKEAGFYTVFYKEVKKGEMDELV